jgi:uncharacterized protein YndB with AHSA1/START domain
MNQRVEIDTVLPHPPERVWRALTDSVTLAEWLMPNDFVPRVGRRFGFTPRSSPKLGIRQTIECRVIEMESERRLTYSWRDSRDSLPDLVTWTLEPVEGGTRLRLEHTSPATITGPRPIAYSTLWCGAAIRLRRFLCSPLVMGKAIPAAGTGPVRAVSLRRVDGIMERSVRCR